jgi:uncharacterized protein
MIVRFLIAATVSFLLSAMGHYYLYVRLIEPLTARDDHIWPTLILALWALTFFGFALARAVPVQARRVVEMAMFVWMGTAYLFLMLCVFSSPFSLGLHFVGFPEKGLATAILAGGGVLTCVSLWGALSSEKIIRASIPFRSELPESLEQVSVVVLSDIHVAGLIGARRMRRLVTRVNALKPDLIFVTGDLVDGTVRQLRNDVLPLKDLQAPGGVFYVTGNHEYYCNAPKWREFCAQELGWKVLSNAHQELDYKGAKFNIIGIEDRSSLHARHGARKGDDRVTLATQGLSEIRRTEGLNILLAHQPKDTRVLRQVPWIDLQVSGHTHGGQLWPLKVFVLSDQKFNKGLYSLDNGTQLYVNQGTGFWGPPMRLGTQCEISVLSFVKKKA